MKRTLKRLFRGWYRSLPYCAPLVGASAGPIVKY
jgi:hypothetical protein